MLSNEKKIAVFLLFLANLFAPSLDAQDHLQDLGINVPFSIYKTTQDTLAIQSIVSGDYLFEPPHFFSNKTKKEETYWVKVNFTSVLSLIDNDSLWFLYTDKFDEATCFYQKENVLLRKEYGLLNSTGFDSSNQAPNGVFFKKEALIADQLLYFKFKRYRFSQDLSTLKLSLVSAEVYDLNENFYSWDQVKKQMPLYLFIGAFSLVFIFILTFYVASKKTDFLFYGLYTLCLVLFLSPSAFKSDDFFTSNYGLFALMVGSLINYLTNLTYINFLKYYLQTKEDYPILDTLINWLTLILIAAAIIDGLLIYNLQFELQQIVLNTQRVILYIASVFSCIYLVVYPKNVLTYFIVIGTFAFTVGALTILFTHQTIHLLIGCTIELFCFGLGLSYKLKLENEENIRNKKEAFENKLSALRAQMNPHFIFNSLNSIQHLISKGNKPGALKYLSKFSRLMRNLLDQSIENSVLLSDEIKTLQTYLELESLRFDGAFTFNIEIDVNLNPDAFEVPTMVVQPFVENAILHGLLNKEGNDKKLNIRFQKSKNWIICEVDDNGIGRMASEKEKSIINKLKKSRGINITTQRLKTLSQLEENHIEIIDKTNAKGEAIGTKVIIKIPTA